MVVQHRFPLLLRKLDPETSISTPVSNSPLSSRFGLFTSPEISIHMPGILIHILPESLFTSPRNLYSHRPGIAIHMPRNTHLSEKTGMWQVTRKQRVLPVSLRRFSPSHSILQFSIDRQRPAFGSLSYGANTRYSKFAEPKRRWSWSTIVRT